LKKFFALPALPSNENNSSNHHNSYNKGPNLVFFSFLESPSNSLPTIKFPKNHITSFYHSNMPKTAKAKIWPLRTLGVNIGICRHHASKLTNYFFVKLIILYNAQLNVSHIQKLYQNDILWYFL
jgi:hypothetical protein